jgi:hypothetical protein
VSAQNLTNLQAIKSNLIATLAAEATYQSSHGPKPTYSLDGESYDWTGYRTAVIAAVEKLNSLIQLETTPFVIRSRARP